LTGSDDGLEHSCPRCEAFVPANAKRCSRCGTEIGTEEDPVAVLLDELSSLLHENDGDEETDEMDSATAKPVGKVRYKKVKRVPP
jgi:hypothetical protein